MSTALQRLPRQRWWWVLGGALGLLFLAVGGLETDLACHGFRPDLADSFPLWEHQRQRVDRLGAGALVLVGNSRVLIDLDLDELRGGTGLEPVQLGVGGASFLPVLQDLAADPRVTGTVLVNFEPQELRVVGDDLAAAYESQRQPSEGSSGWDFADVEASLTDALHAHLRSYADGARPLSSLLLRASGPDAPVQYVKMLPDREELADFSLIGRRNLYYLRAIRDFPIWPSAPKHASLDQVQRVIEDSLAQLTPADPALYRSQYAALARLVAAIRQHGGRVVFLRLPRCGYLRDIDDKRFPRRLFWDPLTSLPGVQTLDFEDVPALAAFPCPDGSHLDMHDKAAFTRALVDALHLDSGSR